MTKRANREEKEIEYYGRKDGECVKKKEENVETPGIDLASIPRNIFREILAAWAQERRPYKDKQTNERTKTSGANENKTKMNPKRNKQEHRSKYT